MQIEDMLAMQRAYFSKGETLDAAFRLQALCKLKEAIRRREDDVFDALRSDLGKGMQEAYMTEIGLAYQALTYMIRHVKKFSSPRRVRSAAASFPSKSCVQPSPYGTVLIMSPWNYPFLLAIDPLIAALAAGNTAVLKPSGYAPATSAVIAQIMADAFDACYVAAVEGGRQENAQLLDQKFDYIFFTGSKNVGRLVMEKAARHLTPVTLELGGKSPCIVDETADIAAAARRIVFGKFLNTGQTCVAPDYVLVHESVRESFLSCLKDEIERQFGARPLGNPSYGKIINEKHFSRLVNLIKANRYFAAAVLMRKSLKSSRRFVRRLILKPRYAREIFGPILPVIAYDTLSEVLEAIAAHPTPGPLPVHTKSANKRYHH
jgi:aldehyde dehydrogenase (NAD+)